MRILSGIQSSGKLHWGNYFGMMKPTVELQSQGQAYIFIANYHALTTVTDAGQLRQGTMNVAIDFLACGLDPAQTVFFRQSDLPEVTELTWLLSTVTPMGLLERCHSYKDKVAAGLPPSHGLFAYPVLMAADILAFRSNTVPVGYDQKQHIEVTRDIAIKFNNQYGDIFTIPEAFICDAVAVVPGLDGRKMSKSYHNHIELFGSEKQVRSRIMKIVTDSKGLEEPKDPDTCNVFALYRLFATNVQLEEMAERYRSGGMGYGDAKQALFELSNEHFGPMRERRAAFAEDPDFVESVLASGAERARDEARSVLKAARQAMGLD